jgi:uncharacterized protein (TIGR01777 family)
VLPEPQSVLITGATGLIGSRLVEALTSAGHDVTVLTRDAGKATALRPPFRLVTDLEQIPVDARIDAIVNLAGEPIANWLWTKAKRRRIIESRLGVTRAVVRLIAALKQPPKVLISASAVGWYGPQGDAELTEACSSAPSFGTEVCGAWEAAAREAERHGVRVVVLRIGVVLGIEGGMLAQLLTPFEYGLGARLGTGSQWLSWIARDDVVRLIAHAVARPELSGPVNATSPEPVRNATFTRELGHALRRPALLAIPAWLLHHVGGAMADELMLASKKVLPAKALASGFVYRYPTLRSALGEVLGRQDRDAVAVPSDYPRSPYPVRQP